MLSKLFLNLSLLGAEWVLYFLILLSLLSVTLMVERYRFYSEAFQGLQAFREAIRKAIASGNVNQAVQLATTRQNATKNQAPDLETELSVALLKASNRDSKILTELAQDSVLRTKIQWDRNLSWLATIGSNAPFVGLFGTVLGIIKAFHDLSQQSSAGAQTVTAGVSEALVATAVGLLVAIPAVVAYNHFQRKVKTALAEAEALKCFLIGNITGN